MSTLTIELPDDLAARLEAMSAQTHVPPAQVVRAALEKALPAPATAENGEPSALDALHDLSLPTSPDLPFLLPVLKSPS